MLPTLEEFIKAAEEGRLLRHDFNNLVGFKYTANTIYSGDWNPVTLYARGIVFDKDTGKVLAYPFEKFFNFGELVDDQSNLTTLAYDVIAHQGYDNLLRDISTQRFRVMDKLDGSLGIMFWTGKTWLIKTAGSFVSEQALWANKWAADNIDVTKLDKNCTYMFEIIYDEDVHPIQYDFEGLVLLGINDNTTMKEKPFADIVHTAFELKINHAEVLEFTDFDEVVKYAKALPNAKEGVVVTFDNGFKVKIKGAEFLALQRLFHYLSPAVIWESFDWENAESSCDIAAQYAEDFIKNIPEELTDLKEVATQISEKFFMNMTEVFNYGQQLRADYPIRKEAYEALCKSSCKKELYAAVLLYYTNGKENSKIREAIYRTVKP
jgi:hypothetical protein